MSHVGTRDATGSALHADAPSVGSTSRALVSLRIGKQPVLALAISSDCRSGVAGSAEATVVVFSLDIPAGQGALLHRVPLPLAGTSAACILAASAPAVTGLPPRMSVWGSSESAAADRGVTAGWDGTVRLVQMRRECDEAAADGHDDVLSPQTVALRSAHSSTVYGVAAWPAPLRCVLSSPNPVAPLSDAHTHPVLESDADGHDTLDELLASGPFGGELAADVSARASASMSVAADLHSFVATAAKDGTVTVYRL